MVERLSFILAFLWLHDYFQELDFGLFGFQEKKSFQQTKQ
jgi:hypothetical protein